ncbi:flagellar assembly peptidoglycan hydrolase FlgJ [Porticoccus sp.]
MAITPLANNQFALDVQGLERLKHSARNDEAGALKEAAKQFEALFLQSMLKSMRDAIPKSDLMGGGSQSQFYDSLMDQQWAQHLSARGVGLADQLVAHLQSQQQLAGQLRDSDGLAGISRAQPRRLTEQQAMVERNPPPTVPSANTAGGVRGGLTGYLQQIQMEAPVGETLETVDTFEPSRPRATGADFVAQLQGVAAEVSEASGIPAELMLAQAVLETGWGRHQMTTAEGHNSYNLFGIKAGDSWQGKTVAVGTHEVIDGQRRRMQTEFRVYDSYRQAFGDYAELIRSQPRYRAVLEAPDAERAAQALQRGGYATDPEYADKLIALIRQGNRAAG